MIRIFLILLCLLSTASIGTWLTQPGTQSQTPLVYWKSDPNPQRYTQIELFHQWLTRNGYSNQKGEPILQMQLDSTNSQSKLIQAVSGVGGDIMDTSITEFQPLGVLSDLTDDADKLGFHPETTYPGLRQDIVIDGKQYGYPCNAAVNGLWYNLDAFDKYGIQYPHEQWTPEEFERIGKEYVKKANAGKERREAFFCNSPFGWDTARFLAPIYRSEGLDTFNETLTKCILDDLRYKKTLKLMHKWTFDEHLFPSNAEEISMNTQSGYGGGNLSQLQSGNYAMVFTGRYCLIRMREFANPARLGNLRIPQYTFQNMIIYSRCAALYKGSNNPQLAKLFLSFLADREYNLNIIENSDGLPPNPKYALNNKEYLHPSKHPNEGNVHEIELKWAMSIALPEPYSPYYKRAGRDWQKYTLDKYFNGLCSASEAAHEAEKRINDSIQTSINANVHLKKRYMKDLKIQQSIDELKAAGKKIPEHWIKNPFYKAYYRDQGMLLEQSRKADKETKQ